MKYPLYTCHNRTLKWLKVLLLLKSAVTQHLQRSLSPWQQLLFWGAFNVGLKHTVRGDPLQIRLSLGPFWVGVTDHGQQSSEVRRKALASILSKGRSSLPFRRAMVLCTFLSPPRTDSEPIASFHSSFSAVFCGYAQRYNRAGIDKPSCCFSKHSKQAQQLQGKSFENCQFKKFYLHSY